MKHSLMSSNSFVLYTSVETFKIEQDFVLQVGKIITKCKYLLIYINAQKPVF